MKNQVLGLKFLYQNLKYLLLMSNELLNIESVLACFFASTLYINILEQ